MSIYLTAKSVLSGAVDGTPAYYWDYDGWRKITGNEGLEEPRYILAHALYRLVPDAKIIAILRQPSERYTGVWCCHSN